MSDLYESSEIWRKAPREDHDPLCHAASPDHFRSVTITGDPFPCDCPLIAEVVKREWGRASDEVEEFRLGLPLATKAYTGGWRSRDDMSWVLAMVRDRIKKGKS